MPPVLKNEKKGPKAVEALISHLRSTGTGKSKLERIRELGLIAKDGKEFLESVRLNVPAMTWRKVEEYLDNLENENAKKDPSATFETKPQGKGRVEVRDDNQSSMPERTILLDERAPTVGKVVAPGVAKSRQLGSDVIVDPNTDPLKGREGGPTDEAVQRAEGIAEGDDGAEEGQEGVSPVADLHADEAKDKISRMQSKQKLEQIATHDERVTVQDAAKKRLEELEAK